jgi:hypothetical protein
MFIRLNAPVRPRVAPAARIRAWSRGSHDERARTLKADADSPIPRVRHGAPTFYAPGLMGSAFPNCAATNDSREARNTECNVSAQCRAWRS